MTYGERAFEVSIHPTAIVDRAATIGRDVEIGPYSIVGPHVVIGDGCRIQNHATLAGYTTLGENCEVFPYAALGLPPQDLKFAGERTTLEIGRNNIFREMVTVHPGTGNGGGMTRIGDNNLLLVGVHVAHDCRIGNRCIIANQVQFAGHVLVEDNVNMGGMSAVHHFVTIGKHAFVGGMTRVAADVPPFMVIVAARGTRSEVRMVNGVGLQRSGFKQEDITALKHTYMTLFSRRSRQNGTPIRDRVQAMLDDDRLNPHVRYLCESLMRSFAHGRHGRYLESLRTDPVRRASWRVAQSNVLTVNIVGKGLVHRHFDNGDAKTVQLVASAEAGWSFTGWNGNLSGHENPIRLSLDSPKVITATFSPA